MTITKSALDAARQDLARRRNAADEAEDWQERAIMHHLAEVADMVCRIGDHIYSAHYRAEKSGPLVRGAIRVQFECLADYADAPEGETGGRMERAVEALEEAASAVRMVLWNEARAGHAGARLALYESEARIVRAAARAFSAWAEEACSLIAPDPVDE